MVGEGPLPDGTGSTSDGPGAPGAVVGGDAVDDGLQPSTVANSPTSKARITRIAVRA